MLKLTSLIVCVLYALILLAVPLYAADYFVCTEGNDAHDGRSPRWASTIIQKGVDSLQPGDTLTIAPGEYFGSVQRTGLGGADADTIIQADYRLQATSRFRARGPSGTDQGAFPYQQNIYYVAPTGDDAADGLALATASRNLGHAAQRLQPGDTRYLIEGTYHEALLMPARSGQSDRPIHLRGRGLGKVMIQGVVSVEQTRHVQFERLNFTSPVTATTANLEWWSSRPAIFRVRWGTTASMENTVALSRVSAYHPANPIENFNTFSLTGLTPGVTSVASSHQSAMPG